MAEDQPRFAIKGPQPDHNMVSESPSEFYFTTGPSSTPTLILGPGTCPSRGTSDTGPDDQESIEAVYSEQEKILRRVADAPWYPYALHFLAQVPRSDADWSRHISCNRDIRSLCHQLKLPSLCQGFQGRLDWSRLFDECSQYLTQICNNPPLASFFSIIFAATCQVALVNGCPRKIVLRGLESCARQCGVADNELTEIVLDGVREGVIIGIQLLKEYTRVVGCRANEIPLHAQSCLQLFQRCDPACFSFIKSHIPSTYRPTTPLQSESLEIPTLVWDLLDHKIKYRVICRILCPEKTDWVCGYSSVDMTDVMEFDERDDGDT